VANGVEMGLKLNGAQPRDFMKVKAVCRAVRNPKIVCYIESGWLDM